MASGLCCVLNGDLRCIPCGQRYCTAHMATLEGSGMEGKGSTGDRGFIICDCGAIGRQRWDLGDGHKVPL
jgi:hypothetical protein